MPYMYFMMFSVLVSFLEMFESSLMMILIGVVLVAMTFYNLLCIYSLYDKFKKEKLREFNLVSLQKAKTIENQQSSEIPPK